MEKERIIELEQKILEYETIISEMSSPIIPSIVPETILVPITGVIRAERFEKIRFKMLDYVQNKEIETAIVDLTDITEEKLQSVCLEDVGMELHHICSALLMMGVRTFFVGLHPTLVKRMVLHGIQLDAQTFSTFQSALQHLMKEKGLVFSKVK